MMGASPSLVSHPYLIQLSACQPEWERKESIIIVNSYMYVHVHIYTTIRKSKAPKPRQWNLPQEVHTLDQLSQHTIALGQVLCLLMMHAVLTVMRFATAALTTLTGSVMSATSLPSFTSS